MGVLTGFLVYMLSMQWGLTGFLVYMLSMQWGLTGGTDWMSDGTEPKKDCFMMLMLTINIIILMMRSDMMLMLTMDVIILMMRNGTMCHQTKCPLTFFC